MKQVLTPQEIEKIQNMCFENPQKACLVAQLIIDTCQIVSCPTYSGIKNIPKRTIQYRAKKMTGITIGNRNFVSLNQ